MLYFSKSLKNYVFLACGLTDADYEKQYWLNIPERDVESPDMPFIPFGPSTSNPDGVTQPMRPPVREFRKRGIHHTMPEQRHVRREEVKTLPNGIEGRVSVQGVESLWGDCRFVLADWGS